MVEVTERDRELAREAREYIEAESERRGYVTENAETYILDAIATARAEGRRQGAEWQPIATVPADGSTVILWFGLNGYGGTWVTDKPVPKASEATHWAPFTAPALPLPGDPT